MNYESIANGEKRIFPYYKGKFLGVTDLGYANKKSAQKFMTQIPDVDVYEKLGGEEHYKRTHGYLCALNSKPFKHFLLRDEIQEGFYDYNCWHKVFLKDLPPSKQEKIWNKLVVDGLSSRYMRHEYVKESVDFEEEFNFFPHLFVDMDDFEKMRKKIRTEEVEYREGIVEIKVTFLDEKSSK